MDLIFLGDYIKQRRKDLGLTQGQLCEGICDVATISRMERGEQTPRHSTVTALLERLGTTYDQYVLLSKEEIRIVALQKELEKVVNSVPIDRTSAIEQYLLSIKVMLRTLEGSISPQEEIETLLKAIHITIPKFNSAKILNRPYYSLEEIRLINQLGLAYSNLGDHKKAVGIFSQLHTYVVERNYGLSKSGGGMPLVAHNYARELTIRKQYEDALDIANEGQAVCLEYGHYQYLPGLIHIMAECQHFLGNDEESKNLYNRAYRLYQEYGNIYNCSILEREVQTYHRTDLDF